MYLKKINTNKSRYIENSFNGNLTLLSYSDVIYLNEIAICVIACRYILQTIVCMN